MNEIPMNTRLCEARIILIAAVGLLLVGCRTVAIVDVYGSFVFDLEVVDENDQFVVPFRLGFADISLSYPPRAEPGLGVLTVADFNEPGPKLYEFGYLWSEEWVRGRPPRERISDPEIFVSIQAPNFQRWSRRISLTELERDAEGHYLVRLGRIRLEELPE